MVRQILSVVAGYAIFVVTSVALFRFSGQDPHATPEIVFIVVTAVYGIVFSFIAGLVTQIISKTDALRINYILALVIAGFALFSFFMADGSHWTQLLAIFIFAPASIIGGRFYVK